jgi:GNAT superfamily N-acetyltransferase
MSDWIIRQCRAEEAGAVLAMWREAGASPSVTDSVDDVHRAILRSPARFLVAEAEGKLIGSVIGSFDGWRANFYRLAVVPAYRRRGLARALVAEIESWLIQQGAKRSARWSRTIGPDRWRFGKRWATGRIHGLFGMSKCQANHNDGQARNMNAPGMSLCCI